MIDTHVHFQKVYHIIVNYIFTCYVCSQALPTGCN